MTRARFEPQLETHESDILPLLLIRQAYDNDDDDNQRRPKAPPATQNGSHKSLGTRLRKLGTTFKRGQLILGKIIKIFAIRCHISRLKCTKFDFGWGCAPDPAGGAQIAPPDPWLDLRGSYLREREEGGKGEGEGEGRGEGNGGGREGNGQRRGGEERGRLRHGFGGMDAPDENDDDADGDTAIVNVDSAMLRTLAATVGQRSAKPSTISTYEVPSFSSEIARHYRQVAQSFHVHSSISDAQVRTTKHFTHRGHVTWWPTTANLHPKAGHTAPTPQPQHTK